jgi:hypothetical protein
VLYPSLKLVLETKAELPITVSTLFQTIIDHPAVKLLAEHFDTKFARFFASFTRSSLEFFDKFVNAGKAFSTQ